MSFDKFWEYYFKRHDVLPEGINKPRAEYFILEYLDFVRPVDEFLRRVEKELKKTDARVQT